MFSVGDSFIYGNSGICKLEEIIDMEVEQVTRSYYVLKPVFAVSSIIYVPVGSEKLEAKMRRLLTAEEIHTLIKEAPGENADWIENENQRKEFYKQTILEGNRIELLKMIKAILRHQERLKALNKKLHVSDERFMKEAEKMLYEEFAYVLGMEREDVFPLIFSEIE